MAYYPATLFVPHFITDAGVPLSGGTISAFVHDTTTPTNMFIDESGTSAGSVITLNARGEPSVSGNTVVIWLDDTVIYKFILKDASAVTKWTINDLADAGAKLKNDLANDTDPALGAALVGYDDSTVAAMLDKQQTRFLHFAAAYDYASTTIVIRDGSADGYHRHFGQVAEGIDGRLHLVYRRSAEHALTAGATAFYCHSNDGGATWSSEVEAIPVSAGADQRSLSMCVTPMGRVVLIYAISPAPSAAPTVFSLRYSDDNGATWAQGGDITTVAFAYARTYGRIKLIPGDSSANYRLAFTPYYQSSSSPSYRVPVWYSEDDGLTWVDGVSIIDDATGYSETEMVAINAKLWFAVSRSVGGLNIWKTTNAGASWVSVGIVPLTSTDSYVAPTLDKFYRHGRWYVLLGYCNRAGTTDAMTWRICDAESLVSAATGFSGSMVTATDMENASGYQCTISKPDGSVYFDDGTAFIEFKEYTGFDYSQVRFVRANFDNLAADAARTIAVSAGAVTVVDSDFEQQIFVDTEAAAATDDLDTISGGSEGQTLTLKSSTSSRDTIVKNGTGNIMINGDYRLTTTGSRIVVRKVGANWLEVARNTDYETAAAYVIASGVITIANGPVIGPVLVDTEAAAATDDLDTISGGSEGQVIILLSATSSRDITVKDGVDNLRLSGDFTLDTSTDTMTLMKRGTLWHELSRSDNT